MNELLEPARMTAGQPPKATHRENLQPERHPRRAGICRVAAVAAALVCLSTRAGAAIAVGPSGSGTLIFDAVPAVTNWSTRNMGGGSGDIANTTQMDTAVQANSASLINTVLGQSATVSPAPSADALARWNSVNRNLQTCPTQVGYNVLMATLLNNTGNAATALTIEYDLGELNAAGTTVVEELPGHQVYYSPTGSPNSWTLIPALSGVGLPGRLSATVSLGTWPAGGTLYVLWADDNAAANRDNSGTEEGCYTIDNVVFTAILTNLPLSMALTIPANGQHFGFGSTIAASVAWTGSPTNVSYFVDDALVATRTAMPFTPVTLPAQTLGSHTVYATAQDASNVFVTTLTNTFVVDLSLSGTLSANTTLYASNSPYQVTGNLTVPNGVTLTIEPGTTVQLGAGVRVIVDGRMEAVGAEGNRIRFTRSGGSDWSGLSFSGNHQSNVLAYADFEYASGSGNGGSAVIYINDSQVTFERDTFLNMSGHKYMDVWWPQVIIRHSVFGDVGASYMFTIENLAPNGWFIVDGNLFGTDTGDNDIFHLNHISVKDGPKAILVNNVFTGAGDDHIDDNESDTHIEGNLFLNYTTNHPPRSAAAAVTTGEGSGVSTNLHTQRLTVVRNVFWGCDYAIINKDGSYVEVYNCVFVNNRGAIIFDEPWRTDSGPGRACYIEGSSFWNNWPENGTDQGTFAYLTNSAAWTTGRYYRGATQVTVNNSILPPQYHYLGTGNFDADPMFVYPTNLLSLSPTNPAFAGGFDGFDANAFLFTNHLIPDVHLLPGSPAIGTGVNGSDMGIYVSDDATIAGEPASPTSQTSALLTVAGLDIGGYKYRLVGPGFTNAWSQELQSWKYVSRITLAGTTATATTTSHGYANGDVIEVQGADSLCPYYNGLFTIRNVTANTFDYTVAPGTNLLTGEPLTITWPIRNEGRTDIWCRRPQKIQLSGLSDGTYRVEAIRKNSMDVWQSADAPTVSKSWTVQTGPAAPHIDSILPAGGAVTLSFVALAGQSYSVLASDSLAPASWQKVENVGPLPDTTRMTVTNTMTGPVRFYRLVSPAQP